MRSSLLVFVAPQECHTRGTIVEMGHDESPANGHSSILVEVSRKAL